MPQPDKYGRYRVRRKGDTASPAWSTRIFNPDRHVIVSGPASDTYGSAWPPKYSRRLPVEPMVDASEPLPSEPTTDDEESDQ